MTGAEFKSIRQSLGLSQRELGRIIRKSESSLRRYEKDRWPILEDVEIAVKEMEKQFAGERE